MENYDKNADKSAIKKLLHDVWLASLRQWANLSNFAISKCSTTIMSYVIAPGVSNDIRENTRNRSSVAPSSVVNAFSGCASAKLETVLLQEFV